MRREEHEGDANSLQELTIYCPLSEKEAEGFALSVLFELVKSYP